MTARREWLGRGLAATRLLPLLRARVRWRGLLVLNYHRIGDAAASPLDRDVFSATAEAFDAQLALLARQADLVAPDDVPDCLERGDGRYVLLTFDDGYRDNYEAAFPILTAHGVRAAFFLCTGFLDRRRIAWWDEIAWMVRTSPRRGLPASRWLPRPEAFDAPDRTWAIRRLLARYKALPGGETAEFLAHLAAATGSGRGDAAAIGDPWMTWEMARELAAAGMEIGGHTVSHPVLARLDAAAQHAEIAGCQARLAAALGKPARWFAYPVGGRDAFDATTRSILRTHGFELGFSFYGGYCRPHDWVPGDLPRVPVVRDTSLATVEAMVAAPWLVAASRPRLPGRGRS